MIAKIINRLKLILLTNQAYAKSVGVSIGVNCKIKTSEFGSEPYLIEIGDNVQVTQGVKFFTHGASWVFRKYKPDFDVFGKIKIGSNVYIGNNALLMPGITIGDNVIIGAGSVVTKSFVSNKVVAGNPAKVIGEFEDLMKRSSSYNLSSKGMNPKQKRKFLLSQPDNLFIKK